MIKLLSITSDMSIELCLQSYFCCLVHFGHSSVLLLKIMSPFKITTGTNTDALELPFDDEV